MIRAFRKPMAIEGHTGETQPEEYWGALAQNRANLIVDLMTEHLGVPRDLAVPRVVPVGEKLQTDFWYVTYVMI